MGFKNSHEFKQIRRAIRELNQLVSTHQEGTNTTVPNFLKQIENDLYEEGLKIKKELRPIWAEHVLAYLRTGAIQNV